MSIFSRSGGSGTLEQVRAELQARQTDVITVDSDVPDGVDTTWWPNGWFDEGSDFYVEPAHRARYVRDDPDSAHERALLGHWDNHPTPKRIEVSWKNDTAAPRAALLDRFDRGDHALLRHLAALQLGYAEAVRQQTEQNTKRLLDQWSCAACGALDCPIPTPVDLRIPGIAPHVRLCGACRVLAFAEVTARLAAGVLPDGRTRGDAVRTWLQAR